MLASAARAALRASVAATARARPATPTPYSLPTVVAIAVALPPPSFLPLAARPLATAASAAAARAAKAAGLKAYRPTTPGFRGRVITARDALWKGGPHKPLTIGMRRTGGRNADGRVTVRHRGGGHRRVYRVVDFWRRDATRREEEEEGDGGGGGGASVAYADVVRIEYDPNRTARLALLQAADPASADPDVTAADGRSYILAPAGLAAGDRVGAGAGAPVAPGCTLPLADIPVGTPVHNVELLPGKGGQMARAAGTAAVVVSRGGPDGYAIVRLPSGAQRRVLATCRATVGALSNPGHKNRALGKAGAARWAGRRPKVRGVAMNSVDHPMGGGRGKSKGRISQSPTGVPAKGKKTRAKRHRTDVFVHVERPRARR